MTALLHVVEVMKFLEMLILRNLRKRVEVAASDLQQANSLDFEVGPHVLKDAEIPESDCGGVVLLDGLERQSSGPIDNNPLMDFESRSTAEGEGQKREGCIKMAPILTMAMWNHGIQRKSLLDNSFPNFY
jgi:hypothetical protein